MQNGAESETIWVTLPAQLEKRLETAARALHCTPSEAALLAVKTQFLHLDKVLRSRPRPDIADSKLPPPND